MNMIIEFQNESEYLEWENQEGNCIYSIQDTLGGYIGDIKESDLFPLWDAKRIVSFDNPQDDVEKQIIKDIESNPLYEGGGYNWSISNDGDKEVINKLLKIKILKNDSIQSGI